jgi:hypothetical protein
MCFRIIVNICLNPLVFDASFPTYCDPYTIKVVYDHTRIASYPHWMCGERREASTANGS